MRLPFSKAEFLDVFGAYNTALWPFALALWTATVAASVQLWRGRARPKSLCALLAFHWAWSGIAYHAAFFTRVNAAAGVFAALFLLQAVAFVWFGLRRDQLVFEMRRSPRHVLAGLLIAYSLAYPALVLLTGHTLPRAPTFGVPCPTMLFTAGVLLTAAPPVPRWLLVVPVLWGVIGGSAALTLSMAPDFMLLVAAGGLVAYAVAPDRVD